MTMRLFSALLLAAGLAAADGLVPNPGFEEGADGTAQDWVAGRQPLTAAGSPGQGTAMVDWAEGSRGDGKRCARIRGEVAKGSDFGIVMSPRLRVLPGFSYSAGAWYRAEGLAPEVGDFKRSAAAIIDVFLNSAAGATLKNSRASTSTNTAAWVPLSTRFTVLPEGSDVQIRLQASSSISGRSFVVRYDDAFLLPDDAGVPNPGFEDLDPQDAPQGWTTTGSGTCSVDGEVRHGGSRAVAVADAGDGPLSGWTALMPARPDRSYRLAGWAKGGKLAANSVLPGGALQLECLDGDERVLGAAALSNPVGPLQDWTELSTAMVRPPLGTVFLRLTVGLKYCRGTAWFDDLRLEATPVEAAHQVLVSRVPKPDPASHFSTNLLANPDLEAGEGDRPAEWEFVGSSARDWSEEDIATYQREGRPHFEVGRAVGAWIRDRAYAGRGALRLESIDPPNTKQFHWCGRNPVDGYWQSAPMPCTAGDSYLASAWACPGAEIVQAWHGPLVLAFYDAKGAWIRETEPVRPGMGAIPAAQWTWWVTRPWKAPAGAVSMRLRVGQELAADRGGWGISLYDNLAVWRLADAPPAPVEPMDSSLHQAWLRAVFATSPPPYAPAPASAPAYASCWVRLENRTTGNCFRDPAAAVHLGVGITNQLGEARTVRLRALCTDWRGAAMPEVVKDGIALHGYAETLVDVELPATRAFGAFHVDLVIEEGVAVVGSGSGRFGVLPALDRKRTVPSIWGVNPLMDLAGDGRASERELGEMMRLAGFGISWVRLASPNLRIDRPETFTAEAVKLRPVMQWYRSLGIRPVMQLMLPWIRPIDRDAYVAAGRAIAKGSADLVEAYGDHGIEQANSGSTFYRGMPDGHPLTDAEYDAICSGVYEGIKAEAPRATVLIGNIATDWECKTINRLYGEPVKGAFDGAILNAYIGVTMTVVNHVKALDAHGDTAKGVWQEETAVQRSPASGEARRYGEGEGAANLVRGWLDPLIRVGPRLKSFTSWCFRAHGDENDGTALVNELLQPRPHFVAHAVMADALADATLVANRSAGDLMCGEWSRGDGPLLVLWSTAGVLNLTLTVPGGRLTAMDPMGNRRSVQAAGGRVTLPIGPEPVYLFGGGAVAIVRP